MLARLMPVHNLNPRNLKPQNLLGFEDLPLLPWPTSLALLEVAAPADQGGELLWEGAEDVRVSAYARNLLGDLFAPRLRIRVDQKIHREPRLEDDASYMLYRDNAGMVLHAPTTWGALHGVSTCYQLMHHGVAAYVERIEDAPRFPWRGLLLDVARHYLPLATLRTVISGMALLKLNVLHLHLSDDQAVRFQSAAFPALADDAAYSAAELRDLVTYAAERGVRVVPELDVPGHVHAWLVRYPQWGGPHIDAHRTARFGVHKAALNPGREEVYTALQTLFTELCAVFPDAYFHIGGDEVHPSAWQNDAEVARLMASQGLQDFPAVQNYFNQRVVQLLEAQGKQVIGWDEVLHADMPDMVVQNWRGATTRDRVLDKSLDCIVSAPYYLDLFYPADLHYAYDPEATQADWLALENAQRGNRRLTHVAAGISWTDQWRKSAIDRVEGTGRVLGGEACLWSELVDAQVLPVRLWSRLPAVAERLWSSREVNDAAQFAQRLEKLFELPVFNIDRMQDDHLLGMGLNPDQVQVAKLLEPVKWYARLLGAEALEARLSGSEMPQARPYNTATELNRIADFLAPESHTAKRMQGWDFERWQQAATAWSMLDASSFPVDIQPAIAELGTVGAILANSRGFAELGRKIDYFESAYTPRGEYMLAPVEILLRILEQQTSE